jgi:riboflavin synthase
MFTGIVSAVGTIIANEPHRLGIEHAPTARRLGLGSSVAVNGCCLTVVKKSGGKFFADVVPETLRRTNLGALRPGSKVNLELPLATGGRLDGHFVQGHVVNARLGREIQIDLPSALRRLVVEKGSIAVDGTSLTVAGIDGRSFTITLIPHTLAVTIAGDYKAGSIVNLEADVIARYVARNLHG